jgi:putative ABC transport system permease protein
VTRIRLALSGYRRHIGRTVFTVLSVAMAFAIFAVLAAINEGLTGNISLVAAQRLNTQPAINAPLPLSYAATIRATPHVTHVTYGTGFSGYYHDPKQNFFVSGNGLPELFDVYPDFQIPAEQKTAFLHDRSGAIIRDNCAEKMGWRVGQTLPIEGGPAQLNGSTTWYFHIDGVYHDELAESECNGLIIAHYEYINEGQPRGPRTDTVNSFIELVDDPKNVDRAAAAVDERFATSSPDTRTQTDQEETLSAMRQFGDIGAIITYVGLAVFASMLLITGNTMANSVRERMGEFAMMRAIGFGRLEVALVVFREAVLLVGAGAVLGILIGWGVSRLMAPAMAHVLSGFSLTWPAIAIAALLALFFALATGFLPGRRVARMPVAATLRKV